MIVEFSILPITNKLPADLSLTEFVAKAIDIIDKSGLKYQVTAMGTIIEGDWEQIMPVLKRCHEVVLSDCCRVCSVIKIDWREIEASRSTIEHKVTAVENILGRKLPRK